MLNNVIADIHTHILYGVDDGARDIYESLNLLQMQVSNGINTIVLTPHFDAYNDSLDIFQKKCQDSYNNLLKNIVGQDINLLLGSETFYSSALMYYHTLQPLCIYGTRYLLMEFSANMNFNKNFFIELGKLILKFEIIPIIAHAERYSYIGKHLKTLAKFQKTGCLIQINANYIIHNIDKNFVKKMFKCHYIDIIASDCHDCIKRPPNLKEAALLINEKYDGYYNKVILNNLNNMKMSKRSKQDNYVGEMI